VSALQQHAGDPLLWVDLDRGHDRSTVTFHGVLVTETQTTVQGVALMLHGEALVVIDVSDVRLTDEVGIGSLAALVGLVRSAGGQVHVVGQPLTRRPARRRDRHLVPSDDRGRELHLELRKLRS
jgi:hypothetical protein